MVVNLSEKNSLSNRFVAELRDVNIQKDRMRFRRNLERLGEIMAYEISRKLNYHEQEVETPLGLAKANFPSDRIVLATILRAGIPLHQGLLNYFDDAENAFISAYRRHHKDGSFEIALEYISCPDLNDAVLILCLPVCNPAVPDCPEGQGCYPLGDQFLCLPAPTVDPGSAGESCEDIAVCDPGLACVEPQLVPDCTSAACCSPYCNVTDPMPPCLPGQQCTAWYGPGMAPEGLEDLGVCALPV